MTRIEYLEFKLDILKNIYRIIDNNTHEDLKYGFKDEIDTLEQTIGEVKKAILEKEKNSRCYPPIIPSTFGGEK